MNVIIDYGLGNIRSLVNWFNKGEMAIIVSKDPEIIKNAEMLILPGVGAYRDAMSALNNGPYVDLIQKHVDAGKPLMGICLGMQLLFEGSYEGSYHKGLGILSGEFISFDQRVVKVPHMGWNALKTTESVRFLENKYVYYVHSYYLKSHSDLVVAWSDYETKVPGIVREKNVLGFQFHPEKSGPIGQNILAYVKEFKSDYISGN